MTADRQLAARAMELAELERALMAIKPVGSIDGHDVVRRESVRDIVQQRALAAQRAEQVQERTWTDEEVAAIKAEVNRSLADMLTTARNNHAEQAQGAEPVAWRTRHHSSERWVFSEQEPTPIQGWVIEPLYTHAQPQAAPNWMQAFEQERAKFQAETLRTSEQATLLQRWIDRGLCLHHTAESAFWSARCESCKLMEETKALLLKPINAKEPK